MGTALEQAERPQPKDISSEIYRIYTYANGERFRIDRPSELYLLDGGASHRVIDTEGVCHYPRRGWVGLSWKQKNGKPFDF